MSIPVQLHDLQLAWEASDPDLVSLLEALASQPIPPSEKPVRAGVATFERFLAEIHSKRFRKKPLEEQAHYRIETLKALEAPNAEAPLPERFRLHEILLTLWQDNGPFARTCLLRAIASIPLVYGPWRALKRIFKEAEARNDTEIYGVLAARFDQALATGQHSVSRPTLAYLARRAWRYLRRTAVTLPIAYADTAAAVLIHYTDIQHWYWRRAWVINHIFYHESRPYNRASFTFGTLPDNQLKDRAFADLWRRSPRPLFAILERAQSDWVRSFAIEALKVDFRAVLREVETAWVVRLLGVGSEAVDDFVVWILSNVPRFEQSAFRTLGLHEAVLRLLHSPSMSARAYAAEYVRTHARDLPVLELIRLVDNDSEAVRKLALDLLQGQDPRKDIGLEAWGQLLETNHGFKLASTSLRKHFGARELTPAWFKARLFSPSDPAAEFVQKLLLELHPIDKLGSGFFADLFDSIGDNHEQVAGRVTTFACQQLARFDLNILDKELLQRLLLNPLTRWTVINWVNQGTLKAQSFALDFLKALAFHPAWETDPWLIALRQSDKAWARSLEFDEGLAGTVLSWMGDVRRFSAADLGFDWLMRLVDRSEPLYHDFAVETMIKAFKPADFAEQAPAAVAAPAGPVDLGSATFLFTGKLATMTRKEAEDKVKAAHGVVAGSVTKKLHYLVIGDEGSPLYGNGKKGDKQVKAEQFNAAGANILIISETAFLQMLAGTARAPASADATLAGCERLWQMATAPGAAEARRGQFARKYILRHHPQICLAQTDRPVDPGAEIPPEFLTFERVQPLFPETRKPLRDFALELARWEFARWSPSADAMLTLHELPHSDVRQFVAKALLADDAPENRHFRINPDTLAPEAVYRFCESTDPDTRKLGMQIIQRSPRLQVPEELFRLTENPDRLIRGFVIRALWNVYRERGVTADWKPPVPPTTTLGAAAKKAATQTEPRGPGVPHHPEKPPAGRQSLAEFLRRVLFEIPPGPPEAGPAEVAEGRQRVKPLPARKAKLELIEVMRDLALEDQEFGVGILPLLQEFMLSRGVSERAACLVAVTRIRHRQGKV